MDIQYGNKKTVEHKQVSVLFGGGKKCHHWRLYWRFYRTIVAGSCKSLQQWCDRISNTIS
jgi:hypothetical protein